MNKNVFISDIGDAKVANNVIHKLKCLFGDTYMDGMTGELHFILVIRIGPNDDSFCYHGFLTTICIL